MVKHEVSLHGAGTYEAGGPAILERTDQDFLPAMLDGLAREGGLARVLESAARTRDTEGVLKLYQPIHRTFHVALLDVSCLTYGSPRLNPENILGSGLVVRRLDTDDSGAEVQEAWLQEERTFRGWVPLSVKQQKDWDPDPEYRKPELAAGHREIDRLLARRLGATVSLRESHVSLFVAPPEVCRATGRTLLYGLIPVMSSDLIETPTLPVFTEQDLEKHLLCYLTAGGPRPFQSQGVTLESLDPAQENLKDFVLLLKQLAIELNAFGTTPESLALYAELNRIPFKAQNITYKAGEFLKAAVTVLLEGDTSGPSAKLKMPDEWPKMSKSQASTLAKLILGAMQAQLKQLGSGQGRFSIEGRRYRVQAFVRAKYDDRCPPETVWSKYSEPFTIAPWYDNNGAPPVQITLPDVTDKGFLKKLKPNVAFAMPESLFTVLQQDANALSSGGGTRPSNGLGIQWLCSFSIPLITICAFIVLNIFLQLFNVVFQWLLFIKICIPIPRRK